MKAKLKQKIGNIIAIIVLLIILFFVFGPWVFWFTTNLFGFPSEKFIIIILIPMLIFAIIVSIMGVIDSLHKHFCSHVWDREDTPRVCLKCGKEERIWADGGYGKYD